MNARTLGTGLAGIFVAIGAGAMVAPKMSAFQYGLPSDDPTTLAWVRASGARDLALGIILFGTLGDPRRARDAFAWSTLISGMDAVAVASVRGLRLNHVIHVGGSLALAYVAARFHAEIDEPPT